MKHEKKLNRSIRRQLGLAAGAVVLSLASSASMAALVDSGTVNIVIPDDIDGIYMNLVTGAATFPAPPAGWDINPYTAAAGQFNLWGATTTTWFSTGGVIAGPYNLPCATSVGPGGTFFRPGGGTNVGLQMTLNSSNNYLGVQFTNEVTTATNYGWIQLQFGATAGVRSIVRYVYENTGAAVSVCTAPVTLQGFSVD
jgi:hypothetical protein